MKIKIVIISWSSKRKKVFFGRQNQRKKEISNLVRGDFDVHAKQKEVGLIACDSSRS